MTDDQNKDLLLNSTDEDPSLSLPIGQPEGIKIEDLTAVKFEDFAINPIPSKIFEDIRSLPFPDIDIPPLPNPNLFFDPMTLMEPRPSLDLVESRLKHAIAQGMKVEDDCGYEVLGKIQCGDVEGFINEHGISCYFPFTEFSDEGIKIDFNDEHLPLDIGQDNLKLGDPITISFEETEKVLHGWVTRAGMETNYSDEGDPEFYFDYGAYCPGIIDDLDLDKLTWLPFEYDIDRKPIKFPTKPKLKIGDLVKLNDMVNQVMYGATIFVVTEVGYKSMESIGSIACEEWDDLYFGWCYRLGYVSEDYCYSESAGLFIENCIKGIFIPIDDLKD